MSRVVLRPYQEAAVDQLMEKLPRAEKGVIYCAATGSGKTKTSARVVAKFDEPSLFLVHRDELFKQTIGAYREEGLEF